MNQGAFDPATWKYGPAFTAPSGAKVWNPVRLKMTRGGKVIDTQEQVIAVQKQGLERFVNRLSKSQPLIYGLISLAMAVAAGWGASTAFRLLRA